MGKNAVKAYRMENPPFSDLDEVAKKIIERVSTCFVSCFACGVG
jgi:hypothetical protein